MKAIIIALALTFFTHGAFAALETQEAAYMPGLYMIPQSAELTPVAVETADGVIENVTGDTLRLEGDEPVGLTYDASSRPWLTFLVSDDEKDTMPARVAVSANDLSRLGLRFAEDGGATELHQDFSALAIEEVASRHGWSHARYRHHGVIHHCVAFVLGKIREDVSGNGKDIARNLYEERGYKKVSCDSPSLNTVASWTGGWHHLGHTAVWNGHCWAADSLCGDPGSLYHIEGCVHK